MPSSSQASSSATSDTGTSASSRKRAISHSSSLSDLVGTKIKKPALMHGTLMPHDFDPQGWWMSEKLDGLRAYWDGENMISRRGMVWFVPDHFREKLPKNLLLDGELWVKRDHFEKTSGLIRSLRKGKRPNVDGAPSWKEVIYFVFDVCGVSGGIEARWRTLKEKLGEEPVTPDEALKRPKGCLRILSHVRCNGKAHLERTLAEVRAKGGEGLMLRKANSPYNYSGNRSDTLLKVKPIYEAEAEVTGHKPGRENTRNSHRVGSLWVRMENGRAFAVGSGLTDLLRDQPPKKGSIIKYRFQELSERGIPRHPIFIGECVDKTQPRDAVVASSAYRQREPDASESESEGGI
ncbi:DNA ligase/mRNA capping enzyme [Tilletiaria anomala UBC 951]|uniref:DNA ligase/mRNA capping enzyme n=1 Tax=Tilletiaria anomala (strain ATCC 24038 / CBS 436.72 / UBC 951) TaxID=1037660 RepID=A0A066VK17_TILAU|nr:DNA ligase/mRNA capping enzyme [Tilletiaria anomala UBC 951]KDN42082.1 DNA ligase/mRNA capping enzyme [Tilletiaria anomala UBC 951]